MKNMEINALIYQKVYIDPKDAFECIKKALGFYESHDSFICIKDGKLQRGEDVSYHGSPYYEYEIISNNPKWMELYKSIECLKDYFNRSKTPEWDKMINCDEELNENNEPVMKM